MAFDKIGIVGGGAWGTALAQSCRRAGRTVTLWAIEPETVADINNDHENKTFLPGVKLDAEIRATNDLTDLGDCDAILMVAPTQHSRTVVTNLAPSLKAGTPIVLCSKGIEQGTGKLLSAIIAEVAPQMRVAVLSGPSFAADVARGLPTAVTLASSDETLGRDLAHAINHKTFRPYWSHDVIGAQIGGATKNVLAIAAGIVVGRELGESARAALVTRGFAELKRFGKAFGGRTKTLSGLSGLGDLILTCATSQSRNMALGQALGRGQTMQQFMQDKSSIAEGALTASVIAAIAEDKSINMPICQAVNAILSDKLTVEDAIGSLLARPLRAEEEPTT